MQAIEFDKVIKVELQIWFLYSWKPRWKGKCNQFHDFSSQGKVSVFQKEDFFSSTQDRNTFLACTFLKEHRANVLITKSMVICYDSHVKSV